MFPLLLKAHVRAYDRQGPDGQTVHVQEHEDKRQRHIEALQEHLRGLQGAVEALGTARERQEQKEAQQAKQKVSLAPTSEGPEKPPPAGPGQPRKPFTLKPDPAVPKALVKFFHSLRNGATLNEIQSAYNKGSIHDQEVIDLWLAKRDHPLAKMEGTKAERFRELMKEFKARRERRHQKKQPVDTDTRSPAEKILTGISSSERVKVQQNQPGEFAAKLDTLQDGASFVIPVASDKKMVGTWKKVTIAGEPYWKKGNTYRASKDFEEFQDSIEKQLAEAPKGKDGKRKIVQVIGEDLATTKTAEKPSPVTQKIALPQDKLGKTATVRTERGTEVKVQYVVVDASELVASHDTDLRQNPQFPAELQPRERSRAASEDQVNRIVQNLQPAFLGENPKASEGAPIVGPDMVVESGNGRAIALQRAYSGEHESAGKYLTWLKDQAEQFGLNPQTIAATKHPVLVRVRQSDVDRAAFAKEANESAVASMSATEQASSDAKQMGDRVMSLFSPGESGEIGHQGNQPFIRAFFQHVIGPAERGRYVTSSGELSQEGVSRIRNAVFAKAYDNPELLSKIAESTDSNIRNVSNALLVAAPQFMSMKEGIKKGELFDLDISKEMGDAALTLSKLKEQKTSVADHLAQQAMFGEMSPMAKDMLEVFDQYGRKPKQLGQVLTTYAEMVEGAGSPQQQGMFASQQPTRAEILEAALRKIGQYEEAETLFSQGKGR